MTEFLEDEDGNIKMIVTHGGVSWVHNPLFDGEISDETMEGYNKAVSLKEIRHTIWED